MKKKNKINKYESLENLLASNGVNYKGLYDDILKWYKRTNKNKFTEKDMVESGQAIINKWRKRYNEAIDLIKKLSEALDYYLCECFDEYNRPRQNNEKCDRCKALEKSKSFFGDIEMIHRGFIYFLDPCTLYPRYEEESISRRKLKSKKNSKSRRKLKSKKNSKSRRKLKSKKNSKSRKKKVAKQPKKTIKEMLVATWQAFWKSLIRRR